MVYERSLSVTLLFSTLATTAALGQDTGRIAFLRHSSTLPITNCELVLKDLSPPAEVLSIPACTTAAEGLLPPANWSHAGAVRWLVFRRRTAGAPDGVWGMLEDGSGAHQVFPQTTAAFNDPFHPALSRDDQWLSFTAKATGSTTYDVFIQSFDPLTATTTGAAINLTQGALAVRDVVVFGPSLPSLGQSSVAFTATGAGGLRDVYRLDLSFGPGGPAVTAGPINLTNTSKTDEADTYGLDWSVATAAWPSGRLAFRRTTGNKQDLVHMAPAAGATPVLVNRDQSRSKLTWSPAGDRILYALYKSTAVAFYHDLVIVSPDGSGKVNLTSTSDSNDYYPTWRP